MLPVSEQEGKKPSAVLNPCSYLSLRCLKCFEVIVFNSLLQSECLHQKWTSEATLGITLLMIAEVEAVVDAICSDAVGEDEDCIALE